MGTFPGVDKADPEASGVIGDIFLEKHKPDHESWEEYLERSEAVLATLTSDETIAAATTIDEKVVLQIRTAKVHLKMDSYDSASKVLASALELPGLTPVLTSRIVSFQAIIANRTFEFVEGLRLSSHAIDLDAKNALASAERCFAMTRLSRPAIGLDDGNEAVRLVEEEPECVEVWGEHLREWVIFRSYFARGLCRVKLGRLRLSRVDFVMALEKGLKEGESKRTEGDVVHVIVTHDVALFMIRWFTAVAHRSSLLTGIGTKGPFASAEKGGRKGQLASLWGLLIDNSSSFPRWAVPWLMRGLSHLRRLEKRARKQSRESDVARLVKVFTSEWEVSLDASVALFRMESEELFSGELDYVLSKAFFAEALRICPSCHVAAMGQLVLEVLRRRVLRASGADEAKVGELETESLEVQMKALVEKHSEIPKMTALCVANANSAGCLSRVEKAKMLLEALRQTDDLDDKPRIPPVSSVRGELFELLSLVVCGDPVLKAVGDEEELPPLEGIDIPKKFAEEMCFMCVQFGPEPEMRTVPRVVRICTLAMHLDEELKDDLLAFQALFVVAYAYEAMKHDEEEKARLLADAKEEFKQALPMHHRSALNALVQVWKPLKDANCLPDDFTIPVPDLMVHLWEALAMKGAFSFFLKYSGSKIALGRAEVWDQNWTSVIRQLAKLVETLCPRVVKYFKGHRQGEGEEEEEGEGAAAEGEGKDDRLPVAEFEELGKDLVEETHLLPEDLLLIAARLFDEDDAGIGKVDECIEKGKSELHVCIARWFKFFCLLRHIDEQTDLVSVKVVEREVEVETEGEGGTVAVVETRQKYTKKDVREFAAVGIREHPDNLLMWFADFLSYAAFEDEMDEETEEIPRKERYEHILHALDRIEQIIDKGTQFVLMPFTNLADLIPDCRAGIAMKLFGDKGPNEWFGSVEGVVSVYENSGFLAAGQRIFAQRQATMFELFEEKHKVKKYKKRFENMKHDSDDRVADIADCLREYALHTIKRALPPYEELDVVKEPPVTEIRIARDVTHLGLSFTVAVRRIKFTDLAADADRGRFVFEDTFRKIFHMDVQDSEVATSFIRVFQTWEDEEGAYMVSPWIERTFVNVLAELNEKYESGEVEFDMPQMARSAMNLYNTALVMQDLHAMELAGLNLIPTALGVRPGGSDALCCFMGFPTRSTVQRYRKAGEEGMLFCPPEAVLPAVPGARTPEVKAADSYQFGVLLYWFSSGLSPTAALGEILPKMGAEDDWVGFHEMGVRPPLDKTIRGDVVHHLRDLYRTRRSEVYWKMIKEKIVAKEVETSIREFIREHMPFDEQFVLHEDLVDGFNVAFGVGHLKDWPDPTEDQLEKYRADFMNVLSQDFESRILPSLSHAWIGAWEDFAANVARFFPGEEDLSMDKVKVIHERIGKLFETRVQTLVDSSVLPRLIRECWDVDPSMRPRFDEICRRYDWLRRSLIH